MKTKSSKPPETTGVSESDHSFAVNLMQFLVVPAFVLDAQGNAIIWNKACERLTGIPAAEVLGTRDHWRGFYESYRPCLSDLLVENRMAEVDELYAAHDDVSSQAHGIHAENWCVMPRLGTRLYLAIDAGPIYDSHGKLLAVIETLRDMTSLKNAQSELERLATHDGLTGIVNRRGFDEKLSMEWSRAIRDKLPLALIMIDVDHFKRYNDAYGHQTGDECLKSVATGLSQANLRSSDVVARYGGEEFALILPSSDEKGAAIVATKIQERIAKLAIPHRGNEERGVVTVSIGVAVISPQHGMKHENLISQADRALYRAKNTGRNRIEVQPMS